MPIANTNWQTDKPEYTPWTTMQWLADDIWSLRRNLSYAKELVIWLFSHLYKGQSYVRREQRTQMRGLFGFDLYMPNTPLKPIYWLWNLSPTAATNLNPEPVSRKGKWGQKKERVRRRVGERERREEGYEITNICGKRERDDRTWLGTGGERRSWDPEVVISLQGKKILRGFCASCRVVCDGRVLWVERRDS